VGIIAMFLGGGWTVDVVSRSASTRDGLAAATAKALAAMGKSTDTAGLKTFVTLPEAQWSKIDVAVETHRDRLHMFVVIMFEPMAMAVIMVVMIMAMVVVVMIVVMVVDLEEIGLDLHDAVEIERLALQHVGDRHIAALGAMQLRIRIDRPNARLDIGAALAFEDDRLNAGPMQQMAKQQTGRAGADNGDLRALSRHQSSAPFPRVGRACFDSIVILYKNPGVKQAALVLSPAFGGRRACWRLHFSQFSAFPSSHRQYLA